mgnify:CR=1 FL=1
MQGSTWPRLVGFGSGSHGVASKGRLSVVRMAEAARRARSRARGEGGRDSVRFGVLVNWCGARRSSLDAT